MAALAEFAEIFEGAEEGIEEAEEGIEDFTEEEVEEIKSEVAEAHEEISSFSEASEHLESIAESSGTSMPAVIGFVVKNAAIGAILYGVTALLHKLFPQHSSNSQAIKRKRGAIKGLTSLIKMETDFGQKTLDWMKEHKDDTIMLGGIEVPLESAIAKHITPVSEAVNKAFSVAKTLQEKIGGKVQFKVPTEGDMKNILAAAEAFFKGYSDLVKFIAEHVQKIKELGSFPIKQADIDHLKTKVDDIKGMPLY